jgi:hypothetical protein
MKPKFLLIFLLSLTALGQKVTATLQPVVRPGLYRIALPRDITAYAVPGFGDLRLYDASGREIPYAIFTGEKSVSDTMIAKLPIVSSVAAKGKRSTYVIDLGNRKAVDALMLSVANTDAQKQYDLTGSNDGKKWFGILNRAMLGGLHDPEKTTAVAEIHFPLSDYRYLKLAFNDSLSLPIDLKWAARKTGAHAKPAAFETFPPANWKISTDIASKRTIITANFVRPEIIDGISLNITGPDFYRRQARITVQRTESHGRHRRRRTVVEPYCFFELRSGSPGAFRIPRFSGRSIRIEIDNRDNQPLEVKGIRFGQEIAYAAADLKPGETYRLTVGEKGKAAPDYDIAMREINPESVPSASVKSVAVSQNTGRKPAAGAHFWQQNWFVWACIICGGGVLAFFAFSLVKDVRDGES